MIDIEVYSWLFVHKEWDKLIRTQSPDKGFEDSFRTYLYSRKINFNIMSDTCDTGLGLSYSTFSGVPHELDLICVKDRNLFVFELKHYEESDISKDIVFTFLGKVLDFYFKNVEILSNYKITMLLVTNNENINDTIRKLCIAYGIKLIEPFLMTLKTIDHFTRDIYQKVPQGDNEFKFELDNLIEHIKKLEKYDYCFSDIFRYKNNKIEIGLPWTEIDIDDALNKIKECYSLFERVKQTWKSEKN